MNRRNFLTAVSGCSVAGAVVAPSVADAAPDETLFYYSRNDYETKTVYFESHPKDWKYDPAVWFFLNIESPYKRSDFDRRDGHVEV